MRRVGSLQLTAIAALALAVIALALGMNVVATILFVIAAVGFLATIFLQREKTIAPLQGFMHHSAYLSIGVTSSSGVGLCGAPGGSDSRGIGTWICKILQTNFREFLFHALR